MGFLLASLSHLLFTVQTSIFKGEVFHNSDASWNHLTVAVFTNALCSRTGPLFQINHSSCNHLFCADSYDGPNPSLSLLALIEATPTDRSAESTAQKLLQHLAHGLTGYDVAKSELVGIFDKFVLFFCFVFCLLINFC